MREENARAAANDRLLQAERAPREADARTEVVPISRVRLRRVAALSGEFDHARSPRNRIYGPLIETVHAVVAIGDRRVGLPTQAQVDRQRLTDRPVVLEEPGKVPTVTVERLSFAEAHAVRLSEQQAGEGHAGRRISRLSGQQSSEVV